MENAKWQCHALNKRPCEKTVKVKLKLNLKKIEINIWPRLTSEEKWQPTRHLLFQQTTAGVSTLYTDFYIKPLAWVFEAVVCQNYLRRVAAILP